MAVTNESTPKSAPDAAKLQGMATPIVTVTKGRKGAAVSILAGKKGLDRDAIMDLHQALPRLHGPGIYTFEVFDEAGDGKEKDKWTVQLGATNSANESEAPVATPGTIPATGQAYDGAKAIGPGLWYNEELGMLINRVGEMYPWRAGQPLPPAFGGSAQAQAQPQAAATPWTMPGAPGSPPFFPPWGQYPALGADDDKVKLMEKQLAEEKEARKEAERRQEMADLRATLEKQQQANDARFEKLIAAMTEGRKDGPSETELQLKASLEAAERRAEDNRREMEAQRREDAIRREMEASKQETARIIAELQANKSDPVMGMITQMMGNMQSSTATIVTAMQEAGRASAETAREYSRLMTDRLGASALTPDKVFEMIKLAKDQGPQAEANKGLAEMYTTVFGMAKDLLILRSEMDGGGESPLVAIARDGVQRIGAVAQAFATTKAREEARMEQAQVQAQQRRNAEIARRRAAMAQQAQQQQAAGAPAVAPQAPVAAIDSRSEAEKIRDAAAAEHFTTPVNPAANEREAAAAALGMDQRREPGAEASAPAQPPAAPPAPVAAAPSTPPVTLVEPPTPGQQAAPPIEPEVLVPDAVTPPPPAQQEQGAPNIVTAEDMSEAQVRQVVARFDDQAFFGSAFDHVVALRQEVTGGLPVEQTADFVLQAVQLLMGGNEYPPALELLHNGHLEVMVERLLPDAPPEYREQLTETLHEIGDEAEEEDAAAG